MVLPAGGPHANGSWDTGITHQCIFTPFKKQTSMFLSVLPLLDTGLTSFFLMFLIRQPPRSQRLLLLVPLNFIYTLLRKLRGEGRCAR